MNTNLYYVMGNLKHPERWLKRLRFLAILFLGIASMNSLHAEQVGATTQQGKKAVSGHITDALGPLIGVTVLEKGTNNGVITDADGKFAISVPSSAILEVSYIGYTTKEIPVSGQTDLSITLEDNTQALDEVVVTGYGTQKKATMTGAISAINSEDISRSTATTASGALVGKIAGLNSRMPDGRPGASTELSIRNLGNPLYVIDGIQSDAETFNNIDFNDIASVSVLKDASAAIYGVRAANGVLVVTTKRGKVGSKNTVSVNGYYGWQNVFRFPKPADASTYVQSYIQSDAILGNPTPMYSMDDLAKWKQGTAPGYRPFDWGSYILRTSPQKYISASTSGGSDNINYHLAISNMDQESIIVNYGGFKRTNVQLSVDAKISSKIKIGGTFRGRIDHEEHPGVPGGDDMWQAMFATYRNLPTNRPYANDNPNYPAITGPDNGINFAMMNFDLSGKSQVDRNDLQFILNGEYDIIDGLTLTAQAGYHLFNSWYDNQEYTYKLYSYDAATNTYPVAFDMSNPWREREIKRTQDITTKIQLNYKKTFGEVHNLNAILANETYQSESPHFWMHDRPVSNAIPLINMNTLMEFDDHGKNAEARLGYIGRLNYDYDGKYLLELSGRYDGSYQFAPDKRWGFFPSASVGWRISEENFWKGATLGKVMDNLKVRASYGKMGDDHLTADGLANKYNPLDYISGYNYNSRGSALDGNYIIGSQSRGLPVTTMSWLVSTMLDVGVDYSFFGGKLSGTFDYFNRTRNGLPATRNDVLIPTEAGFSSPFENLNSDINKGVDGSLMWRSKTGKLTYSVGGNFTFSRRYDGIQYNAQFGNSWDQYRNDKTNRYSNINWGYHAIGQFQSWEEIAQYKIDNDQKGNSTIRPGDIKYEDVNGDGVISELDMRPIGYQEGGLPYFNYGLNFGAAYKGFDLSIDLTGAAYASFTQDSEARNPFWGGGNNPQYYMTDQWRLTDPSDPNSTLIPGKYPTLIAGNSGHSDYWHSDYWTTNVRYLKLRNLELGYTLPAKILNKYGISKFRIYTQGQNLISWDNVSIIGIDPEITNGSGVQYPTNRVYNIGFNLTF